MGSVILKYWFSSLVIPIVLLVLLQVSCSKPLYYVSDEATLKFLAFWGLDSIAMSDAAAAYGYSLKVVTVATQEGLTSFRTYREQAVPFVSVPFLAIPDNEKTGVVFYPPEMEFATKPVNTKIIGEAALIDTIRNLHQKQSIVAVRILATRSFSSSLIASEILQKAMVKAGVPVYMDEIVVADYGFVNPYVKKAATDREMLVFTFPVVNNAVWTELSVPEIRFVVWGTGAFDPGFFSCVGSIGPDLRAVWERVLKKFANVNDVTEAGTSLIFNEYRQKL